MLRDVNTRKVMKNAFRITKHKYKTALRVRVPGGLGDPLVFRTVADIAEKFGDGRIHITTRQGFEILGIDMEDMPEVNEAIQPVIDHLDTNQEKRKAGYPASGTRNVAGCIGNKICPKAQYNTTEFAKEIEDMIFPNDLHVKIALTGCPNDCIKSVMHDFGIIGMCLPEYDQSRCVACQACVNKCKSYSVGALSIENNKIVRNHEKCIGCGECVLNCPMLAWTRSPKKYFRLVIMGRTGKKNPRIAKTWLKWVDKPAIMKIIANTYEYTAEYIDPEAPNGKEHIGYIVDPLV